MELTAPVVRPIGRPPIRTVVGALAALLVGLIVGGLLLVAVATTLLVTAFSILHPGAWSRPSTVAT